MARYPLDIPPGLVTGESVFSAQGRYVDASMIRFVQTDGGLPPRPEIIGGFESLTLSVLDGITRNSFSWTDLQGRLNVAFGTHKKLYVWRSGVLTDITPTLALPPKLLAADPLAVTSASAVVTVTHVAHGLATAETITISGAEEIGGITPNGTFPITVVDEDSYTYTFTSSASSTVSGGGGSAVLISPQRAFAEGKVHGTAGRGYGTSTYGAGFYGLPSVEDTFPRTWTFDALGEALIACPRGGTIYLWENDITLNAEPVPNAPAMVTAVVVTDERAIVAVGCNEETSGRFNPLCLRHSDLEDYTIWTTQTDTTAREKVLAGGGRLVGAKRVGYGMFIWTNSGVFQGTYIGALDEVYRVDALSSGGGLIGANAMAVRGQTAYWLSPDFQMRACALGGEPQIITLPFRSELDANLAVSQQDKIVVSTLEAFEEIWIFYPDARDGLENSRALSLNLKHGSPCRHLLARTSFIDAGVSSYPIGVTSEGRAYWHERGHTADGAAITGFLESGPQALDSEGSMILITSFWPDCQVQAAPFTITFLCREYPQDETFEEGPYVISPGQSRQDLHVQARVVGFRLDFSSGPARLRIGTPVFEGRATGKR